MATEHWYQKAAELMVLQGLNLWAATQQLDLGVRKAECEVIERSKEFLEVLRGERNKYYKSLALDPTRSRTTAVGQLLHAIDSLLGLGQFDKAVEAIFKLARLEGWTNEQAAQNVFLDLSGKDFTRLKEQYKAQTSKAN